MVMKTQIIAVWVVMPCSFVKMEATRSSKMFVSYHITTQCHTLEDHILQ